MKPNRHLNSYLQRPKSGPNTLSFLVFGSEALGKHHEKSDIDVITVLRNQKPSAGLENTLFDGIKVGILSFNYEILAHSVNTVPYLLHPLGMRARAVGTHA